MAGKFPIRHENSVLETISEKYFRDCVPESWIVERPSVDMGIDLVVSPVVNREVEGLNFSVQLKAVQRVRGKLAVRLKTSTINYLYNRLEPVMIVLYDHQNKTAYWTWLSENNLKDSSRASQEVTFDQKNQLDSTDWVIVRQHVQNVFKVQKHLLTSMEYDLFLTSSDQEAKAWSHYFKGNLQEAAFYFERLINKEQRAVWLLALAQCEYQSFQYPSALLHINMAFAIDKNDHILVTKGCILAEDGIRHNNRYKLQEAEEIFRDLFERNPSATHAYNYANTLTHLQKYPLAEKLYKKAVRLMPDYAEAWKNLGQLYYYKGRHDQEFTCYDKALSIDPYLSEALISKGITTGQIFGKYKLALQLIEKGIAANTKVFLFFPRIYFWLSAFSHSIGRKDDALMWINKGLDNNPGSAEFLQQKGQLLMAYAIADKTIAKEASLFFAVQFNSHPRDAICFYYLCQSLVVEGRERKARLLLEAWIGEHIYPFVDKAALSYFSFQQLMLLVRYIDVIKPLNRLYSYPQLLDTIQSYSSGNAKSFVNYFFVARNILAVRFNEQLDLHSKRALSKTVVQKMIKECFYAFPKKEIAMLLKVKSKDPKKVAEPMASLLTGLSHQYLVDITRTISFAAGFLIKDKKKLPKFEELIDGGKIMHDVLLKCLFILYRKAGLPLK